MGITIKVKRVKARENDTRVEMEVDSPKMTPQMVRENRARARALMAVGLANTIEEAVRDLSDTELSRKTTVMSHKKQKDLKYGIRWNIAVHVRR